MTSRLTGHTRIQVLYYSDSPTKIEDTTKNRIGCQQLTQGTKESDSHAFVTSLFGISPIDASWPCAMFFVLAGSFTHSISSPPVDTWFHQSGVFRSYFPRRPFEGMICSVHNSYFVLGLPHRELSLPRTVIQMFNYFPLYPWCCLWGVSCVRDTPTLTLLRSNAYLDQCIDL
jgi:hypothetical protein